MKKSVIALCAALICTGAAAGQKQAADERILNSLNTLLPGLVPDEIRATPVDDLYEVTFGTQLVYVTGDGRFMIQGKLIDLETRTALTEKRLTELTQAALATVGEDRMVVYGPDDAAHTITVFTDIDCGFCRKMHSEMASYNGNGIRIRYLFYPRAGVGSESYDKAVSVWCADDRRAAMDAAKAGSAVEAKSCENPVAEHYALGQSMRVQGTPALVLEGGEMVPGYVPADKLRRMLDQQRANAGG